MFVGMHDYYSGPPDSLRFKKGDLLYIINRNNRFWWYAKSKHTGEEGYIPYSYVAVAKSKVVEK